MRIGRFQVWCVSALLAAAAAVLAGCNRQKEYSQDTPDDVLRSAAEMIRDGQTQRLPDLIAADNDEMRRMLNRLGVLFGNMQQLALAAQERFPDDLAKIKADAEARAASGEANPLLGALRSGGRGGPPGEDEESAVKDLVNRLFADPYGWLERNSTRLTAEKIADDQAMVLLDGEPLIPIVGLPMIERDGKWYIALPTNMPPLNVGWPKTKPQWDILRSLVTIIDKAVIEMTEDIRQGRVGGLDQLANKAQEKMIFPAAMAFLAYQREIEVRTRVDRRMTQFRARQREWARSAKDRGREVSAKLLQAIERVAPAELEQIVRKRTPLAIDQLSDADFEVLAAQWLGRKGLTIALDGDVGSPAFESRIQSWLEAQNASIALSK
jgi:hypothetical protein